MRPFPLPKNLPRPGQPPRIGDYDALREPLRLSRSELHSEYEAWLTMQQRPAPGSLDLMLIEWDDPITPFEED